MSFVPLVHFINLNTSKEYFKALGLELLKEKEKGLNFHTLYYCSVHLEPSYLH